MSGHVIQFFFMMRSQLKLYHWQTSMFARHKASDEILDTLDGLIDEYVEVYMGKYGRPKLSKKNNVITIENMNDKSITKYIHLCILYLQKSLPADLKPTDTDLLNIRDEMLGNLNKFLYLTTLK
jgi:hypothetical protein